MEIPAAGAAPWLVLGAVLGIALVALVGATAALLLRPRGRSSAGGVTDAGGPPLPDSAQDDLPGFLEFPPGCTAEPAGPPGGWPTLAPPLRSQPQSQGPPADPVRSRSRHRTVGALVAMTTATLVLIGVAAAMAVARSPRAAPEVPAATPSAVLPDLQPVPPAPAPGAPGAGDLAGESIPLGSDGVAAQLDFAGVVLERRAVGITAAYPALTVTWDGDRALAHLELVTYNCLGAVAPGEPGSAGCSRSVPEYADLPSPALTVRREGDRLAVSGAFPTYLRPNGSPPVWTGRVYDVAVTVEPESDGADQGWRPAVGTVRLGTEPAVATGTGRIRFVD